MPSITASKTDIHLFLFGGEIQPPILRPQHAPAIEWKYPHSGCQSQRATVSEPSTGPSSHTLHTTPSLQPSTMAGLPAELIHAILANMTDHTSMINLALISRLYYATAMPVVLAEESRYVREVMIPGKHLSIHDLSNSPSKLPHNCLDSPAGLFTGSVQKISFKAWQNDKYLCCIRRIVQRVRNLERIVMTVLRGSHLGWITAYMNICVGRPGVELTLHGGEGRISFTDDQEPYHENWLGEGLNLSFDHPLQLPTLPPISSLTTKRNRFSMLGQRVKLTPTQKSPQQGPRPYSASEPLIVPRITGLKLVNECLFDSLLAPVVHTLAAGEHVTSLALSNASDSNRNPYTDIWTDDPTTATTSMITGLATLNIPSLTRFSIATILLPTSALVNFLTRHPSITELYLDLLYPSPNHHLLPLNYFLDAEPILASPQERFMPNLSHLAGSVHWVLPFVQWRQSKERRVGDTGQRLPALEVLELRTGAALRKIWGSSWTPENQQTQESINDELDMVYAELFCASHSSATSQPAANTGATTHIRSLILESLSQSRLIDWLILEAVKHQAWPVLSSDHGVGLEKLTISTPQEFSAPARTRVALMQTLRRLGLDLPGEVMRYTRARARDRRTGEDRDSDSNEDAPFYTIDKDEFTQLLLERVLWYTFPSLQMLQIGLDKTDRPPPQQISRPGPL